MFRRKEKLNPNQVINALKDAEEPLSIRDVSDALGHKQQHPRLARILYSTPEVERIAPNPKSKDPLEHPVRYRLRRTRD